MKMTIDIEKALADHNSNLEMVAKKLDVEEHTNINTEIAKSARKDFANYLIRNWNKYVKFTNF